MQHQVKSKEQLHVPEYIIDGVAFIKYLATINNLSHQTVTLKPSEIYMELRSILKESYRNKLPAIPLIFDDVTVKDILEILNAENRIRTLEISKYTVYKHKRLTLRERWRAALEILFGK